jgi:hypothetical protein
MTEVKTDPGPAEDDTTCWCCGQTHPPAEMVHLGNHPEVGVCTRCAHSLHTWAWQLEDKAKTGPGARARNAFRTVRHTVMDKGLHRNPIIGRPLKWLGKHLP